MNIHKQIKKLELIAAIILCNSCTYTNSTAPEIASTETLANKIEIKKTKPPTLSWSSPPNETYTGTEIEYQKISKSITKTIRLPIERTEYRLNNLEKGANYEITIYITNTERRERWIDTFVVEIPRKNSPVISISAKPSTIKPGQFSKIKVKAKYVPDNIALSISGGASLSTYSLSSKGGSTSFSSRMTGAYTLTASGGGLKKSVTIKVIDSSVRNRNHNNRGVDKYSEADNIVHSGEIFADMPSDLPKLPNLMLKPKTSTKTLIESWSETARSDGYFNEPFIYDLMPDLSRYTSSDLFFSVRRDLLTLTPTKTLIESWSETARSDGYFNEPFIYDLMPDLSRYTSSDLFFSVRRDLLKANYQIKQRRTFQ